MNFHSETEDVRTCLDIRQRDCTVQSQYSSSLVIKALVDGFHDMIDPSVDEDLFYRKYFDVETAEGPGLDIWGRIVAIGRQLTTTKDGQPCAISLTDDEYRQLILWKALANISAADAASINRLLAKLFDGLPIYIIEVRNMHIRLVAETTLTEAQRSIMRSYGLFARGAGVGFEFLETGGDIFGFEDSGLHPLDQAPFFSGVTETLDSSRLIVWR